MGWKVGGRFRKEGTYIWCSVAQLCPILLRPHGLQNARPPDYHQLPELAKTHVHWVRDASKHHILSCPFSSWLQSFPASRSFLMSQLFPSGGQSIAASALASASVLPMNTQNWSPLGWTGWISLQSKGFSSLLQHHSSKASILQGSAFIMVISHIHAWLLEKP